MAFLNRKRYKNSVFYELSVSLKSIVGNGMLVLNFPSRNVITDRFFDNRAIATDWNMFLTSGYSSISSTKSCFLRVQRSQAVRALAVAVRLSSVSRQISPKYDPVSNVFKTSSDSVIMDIFPRAMKYILSPFEPDWMIISSLRYTSIFSLVRIAVTNASSEFWKRGVFRISCL